MNTRLVMVAVFACLLAACGGGGGGGAGGVPPPSTSPGGSFTLSSSTADFNARTDGPLILHSSIALHVNDTRDVATIGAAYVAPNQPAAWLLVGITGSGADYAVNLDVVWTGMTPGTYSAVISTGTANAGGGILQRRDITVTLVITEITVRAAPGLYNFRSTYGHSAVTQSFTMHVDAPAGRTWSATSTAAWIKVPTTIYSGPADVPVVIDATGLALQAYTGQVQFTSQANAADNTVQSVMVSMLAPALTLSRTQVTLGSEDGNGSRQVAVLASLDTGTNTYPVTLTPLITSGGGWLSATSSLANIGAGDLTLNLAANVSSGGPGHYDGTVLVTANVLGQTIQRTIDVRYNQDQDRLVAATLGAAFSKFPTRSVLRRGIRISDAQGRTDIPWSASDDASWLSVTASGTSGGEVLLVADPAGLATNQIYYATVTVVSASPLIDNNQRIRVALKVNSTDPVATSLSQVAVSIVANPVEPVVYASLTGGAIEVRDVHTGALVNTFNALLGPDGGALAISDDGLTLFAIDGWVTQRVVALNAGSGAVVGEFPLQRQYTTTLHYMRPNAHPVLITGHGEAFDVATRTAIEGFNLNTYYPSNKFAHTSNHRFIFSQDRAFSPASLDKARIAWSTLVTPALVTEYLQTSESGEAGGDVCVSSDDSRVMTAGNRIATPFNLLNSSDLAVAIRLPAQTYGASNVACLWNGLYMGSTNRDPPVNLFFYDAQGNEIASSLLYQVDHEPMMDRIIVSGDASRVIAVTGGPSFHTSFFNAPLVP
jgi:hypothetical protein